MVWMVESQIHQQYSCSLCSTVHLQYVHYNMYALLMLTALGLKRKISLVLETYVCILHGLLSFLKNIYSYAVVTVST